MYTEISKQHWRLKGKAPGINLMLGALLLHQRFYFQRGLCRGYETAEMLWNIFANNFDQLQFTELNTTTEYRETDR